MDKSLAAVLLCICCTHVPAQEPPPDVPLVDFVRHAEFELIKISPDGKRFAATYRKEGNINLAVINREKTERESDFDFGDSHRVTDFHWVSDKRLVIDEAKFVGFLDTKGDAPRLWGTDYDGKRRRALSGSDSGNISVGLEAFRVVDTLPGDPKHIVVGQFSPDGMRPYKLDVLKGRKKYLGSPKLTSLKSFSSGFAVDNDGDLRFVVESAEDDVVYTYYSPKGSSEWSKFTLGKFNKRTSILPLAFSKDGGSIFLASDHEGYTDGIYEYDLDTGNYEVVFRDPYVDASSVFKAHDNSVLGLRYMPDKPDTLWFDPEHAEAKDILAIQKAFPGSEVRVTSHTDDGKEAVVYVFSDTNPGSFYIFNSETKKLKFLMSRRPWIKPEQMAPMKPIKVVARDGLELRGYLTVPPGSNGENLPLVVNPHGGPHGPRDRWGYNWEVQFLANRGYAVLQINFRGSGGYGDAFEESGHREWGAKMQDDITDATHWAVEQGIANPERLCIYGGSYGGYAALMGAAREPELYACAIGYVGVYDMKLMHACGDIPDRRRGRAFLKKVHGTDPDVWAERSPTSHAKKMKASIFIAHGEDDVRVPMCQAKALTKALKKAGKEFVYMTRDEGHGYQKLENRIDFYSEMERFLAVSIGH